MRLLLIEDHVAVADLLRDALREDGHEVSVAYTGEDGLRELARSSPDAVFLDVALPAMDGVAVLREIRARNRQLPVIVLTGFADGEQIEQLESLGVSGVLQKADVLAHFNEVVARLPGSPRSYELRGENYSQ
jgi:DNA-binding response OmpR family regulator